MKPDSYLAGDSGVSTYQVEPPSSREHDAIFHLTETLVGVRMLAARESSMGQSVWTKTLPLLDDAIELGTAVLHSQSCQVGETTILKS